MSIELWIGIAILVFGLVIGIPVAFSFASAALFLIVSLNINPSFLMPYGYSKVTAITLLCMPMFIIAGNIMKHGKIGDALIGFVEHFIGKSKSALGVVTAVSCAVFGAIAGSAAATISCIGSIMAPKLRDRGYPRGVAASLIAASSVLGLLIPPSSQQVIYAWASGTSVLACFLATVIPGLMVTTLFCVVQHFQVRKLNMVGNYTSATEGMTFGKKFTYALPALFMPVIILGGIYSGIMTPTEAAAVAAFYCIPVAIFIYKGIRFKQMKGVMVESGASAGSIIIMLISSQIFGRILVLQKVPDALLNLLKLVSDEPAVIMLMVNLIMVCIGMLMDDGSGIMLSATLLLPVVQQVGYHPVHFAAILGVNLGMGLTTPPMASMLYYGAQICDAPVGEMLKPTLQLIFFAWIPTLLLTIFFPEMALFLPRLAGRL